MTRPLVFMPAARLEAMDAQDWYEREAPGLGARFRTELDRQAGRIIANPLQFPVMLADIRRAACCDFHMACTSARLMTRFM